MAGPGDRIGEYVLDREIGAGRFGQVWRAVDHLCPERVFAIKIATDGDYVRVLQHEGRLLRQLDHPNVVRVVSLDPYAETPYLAMEYVDGCSLRPLVGRLDVEHALEVLRQLLMALDYAHRQNIVHRDLKPENVLVERRAGERNFQGDGLVKLSDFGLARAARPELRHSSIAYSGSINRANRSIAGTVAYMAPELLDGAPADAASDVYSCGIILFEMLTGRRPAGIATLGDIRSPMAPALHDLFCGAYAPRENRFESAAAFLEALRAVRDTHAGSGNSCEPSSYLGSAQVEPQAGDASDVEAQADREVRAAEARARVETARAASRDAEARLHEAEATRQQAEAAREAAAAEAERATAARWRARAERLRAKAVADQARGDAKLKARRIKAEKQRINSEIAAQRLRERAEQTRLRQSMPQESQWGTGRTGKRWMSGPAADRVGAVIGMGLMLFCIISSMPQWLRWTCLAALVLAALVLLKSWVDGTSNEG